MSGSLQSRLAAARRRWRAVQALGGLALLFSLLAFLALVSFHTDRAFAFTLTGRLAWLVVLCGTGLLGGAVLVGLPLVRRVADENVAVLVERRYPALQERLLTTVELAAAGAMAGGSPAMAARLSQQTEQMAAALNFRRAVPVRALARPGMLAVAAGVLLLAHVAVVPGAMRAWLWRVLFPYADVPVYARTHVWVGPEDRYLPRGEDVGMYVRVGGHLSDRAVLHYRFEGSPWASAELTGPALAREADGEYARFGFHLNDLQQDVTYYGTANDGRSNPHTLHVEDRPTVLAVRLGLVYPAYTRRPAETVTATAGNIVAPLGTRVSVEATANKPLRRASFVEDGQARGEWRVSGSRASGSLVVTRDQTWGLKLRDTRGFDDLAPPQYTVRAQPDLPPTVQIDRPGADLERTPGGVISLRVSARDDYGVEGVALAYRVGRRTGAQSLGSGGGRPQVALGGEWYLGGLSLKAGDTVVYEAQARDNDAVSGPHLGHSASYRVRIVDAAEMSERLDLEARQEQDALRRLIQRQKEAQSQLARAQTSGKREERAQAQATQQSIAQETNDLARRMEQTTSQMKDNSLAPASEVQRREAGQQALQRLGAADMPRAAASISRQQLGAAARQEQSIRQELQRIADQMAPAADMNALAQHAEQLAQQQQHLAEQSDLAADRANGRPLSQLTAQERANLSSLSTQQAAVRAETQALQRQVERAAQNARERGQPGAQTLERAAQQMAQGQLGQRQTAAEQSLRSGDPAQAARPQDQAASTLRDVASTLDPAGAASRNADAIDRRADNLDKVGDRLQEMANQQGAVAREALSNPQADAIRRLDQRQQALQAQAQQMMPRLSSVPDARQNVSRASGNMAQSQEHLARSAATQASGPANEATRQLLQAAQDVQEAVRQLRMEAEARRAQAAVEQLARDQRALKQETRQLDASHPAGNQSPELQQKANALAQKQAKLAERSQGVSNDLPSDGYRFVMREATQRMQRAGAALWQKQTGPETQMHQEHAAQILDRMARALAQGAQAHEQMAQGGGQSSADQAMAEGADELQLAREMEAQIRQETASVDERRSRSPNRALTPEQQRDVNALAQAQRETRNMARRVGEQMRGSPPVAKTIDQATQEMEGIQDMLLRQQTENPTQQRQEKVIGLLDQASGQVREAMRQQRQQMAQQSGRQQSSQQISESRQNNGRRYAPVVQAQPGAFGPMGRGGRGFGNLSPRAVEALRQGQQERVPAEYRDLVNQYYRALSERSR